MVDQESVRPLAKSAAATAKAAPAPGYEIVARAITGDDPPAWLVIFLKMWGPCLAVDRGVAAVKLPTSAHMRETLQGAAADTVTAPRSTAEMTSGTPSLRTSRARRTVRSPTLSISAACSCVGTLANCRKAA